MKPAIVLPIHDPTGIDLPYLARIETDLKPLLFQRPALAWETHPENYCHDICHIFAMTNVT